MTIKDVQLALKDTGIKADGIAGVKTYAAVKAFQITRHLPADGVIDWDVLEALFPGYLWSSNLSIRAMQIAETQVGVREATGKNDGLSVEAYLKAVGLRAGYSYCCAFIVWCYDQAAKGLGVHNPLPRTGSVITMANYLRSQGLAVKLASTGCLFYLDLGNGHGHIGFVRAGGYPIFDTVEGNTNDDGSANGNGDYFRERDVNKITGLFKV